MAQLKKTDIYEGGNPFIDIENSIKELIKLQNVLKTSNEELIKEYRNIKKDNSGKTASELIKITNKLKNNTDKLIATEKLANEVEKEKLKIYDDVVKKLAEQEIARKKAQKNNKKLEGTEKLLIEVEKQKTKVYNDINKKLAEKEISNTKEIKALEKLKIERNNEKKQLREQIQLESASKTSIDKEANSIAELRKKTRDLVRQRDNLNIKSDEGKKQYVKLTKAIKDNNDKLISLDEEISRHQRKVGRYGDAIGKLKGRFDKLKAGFSKFAAVFGVIGVGIAAFVKLNKSVRENQKITSRLNKQLKINKSELKESLVIIKQLSAVYGTEYNEVIKSANVLSKQMGISGSDALTLIQKGFEKGANNSGEFLDILKEYPTFFKESGLKADEAIALITQSVNSGVFSDKGIDAIKEATIRIRQMPKATKQALESIGIDTKEMQKKLKDGSTSYFKIMQDVSDKLAEIPGQGKKVSNVIANIFGTQGEDAGLKFILTLGKINTNLSEIPDNASDAEKASINLTKAWTELTTGIISGQGALGKSFTWLKSTISDAIKGLINLQKYGIGGVSNINKALDNAGGDLTKLVDNFNTKTIDLQSNIRKLVIEKRKLESKKALGVQFININEIKRLTFLINKVPELNNEYSKLTDTITNTYDALISQGIKLTKEQLEFFATYSDAAEKAYKAIQDADRQSKKEQTDTTKQKAKEISESYKYLVSQHFDFNKKQLEFFAKYSKEAQKELKKENDLIIQMSEKYNLFRRLNIKLTKEQLQIFAKYSKEAQKALNELTNTNTKRTNTELNNLETIKTARLTTDNTILASKKETDDKLLKSTTELAQKDANIRQKRQNDIIAKNTEIANITLNAAEEIGATFGQILADTKLSAEEHLQAVAKASLKIIITTLERVTVSAIAEVTMRNIATLGFVGLLKAAGEIALVTAASEAAKAKLSEPIKLAKGGEVHGKGSKTSDNVPAMLSDGEYVINANSYENSKGIVNQINAGILTDNNVKNLDNNNIFVDNKSLKEIAQNTAKSAYVFEKDNIIYINLANGNVKKILK